MKTLRIFISSPGDVKEERDKAKQVIADLQRRYDGQATLMPVLWEDLAIPATASFQEGIDFVLAERHRIDIAVFILWSRLGSPLGAVIKKPDGSVYHSGTEREFDLMLAAFEQSGGKVPIILAYTRRDEEGFNDRLDATKQGDEALEELLSQRKLVKRFIRENFKDKEGHNLRAYHSYREPVAFAQRLHVHLRGAIDDLLDLDTTHATWAEAPYRSLEVFDIQHAPIFCGRDEETCDLLQRLRDQQQAGCAFVCIVGASGSGKSSLARAGVAATLIQRSFEDGIKEWRTAVLLPSLAQGDLPQALARTLAEALPELRTGIGGLDEFIDCLRDQNFKAASILLTAALNNDQRGTNNGKRVLIILDQMEELWTDRSITQDQREHFLQTLEALARSGHITVLATLRSDFYPQAQLSEAFLRMKGERGHFDLTPPGPAALQQLIVQPAHRAGLRFERDEHSGRTLDQRILEDASRDPSALPLLQYALAELHERREEKQRLLTFAAYDEMGGVEGVLGKRAAQTFEILPPEVKTTLDELLPLLISVDITGEQNAVRRRAPATDLSSTAARRQLSEALIAARFLTTDEQGGTPIATFAHEALLRRWDRITTWINSNRDLLRMRARVEQYQAMWEESGRDSSRLLPSGLPLEEGRRLRDAKTQLIDEKSRCFVNASSEWCEQMQRRSARLRWVAFAVLGSLTVTSLIGVIVGLGQTMRANQEAAKAQQANEDSRRTLKEASMADYAFAVQRIEKDHNWNEGVAYLVRALKWDPLNLTAGARLYSELTLGLVENSGLPTIILQDNTKVSHTATGSMFSSDGSKILTFGGDLSHRGEAIAWDAASGRMLGVPMRMEGNLEDARFNQSGMSVVTAVRGNGSDISGGDFSFWDVGAPQPKRVTFPQEAGVWSAEFSPDGTRVVTASTDGMARIWDVASGKQLGGSFIHSQESSRPRFSPDGRRLVTVVRGEFYVAKVWDTATGALLCESPRHEHWIWSARFSPDGKHIVTASDDGTARVCDAGTGKPLFDPLRHDASLSAAHFSPDGTSILTSSKDKTARLWDAVTGRPIGEIMRHEAAVNDARFSRDGLRIVTASEDRTVRVWDATTGVALGSPLFHPIGVKSAEFSPDGMRLLTVAYGGIARVWDAPGGRPLGEPVRYRHGDTHVEVRSDGRKCVTASGHEGLRIWDLDTGGRVECSPSGSSTDKPSYSGARFSPDHARIVSYADSTAQVWDATTGTPAGSAIKHSGRICDVQFSSNGSLLVTASRDGTARIWNAATGAPAGAPLLTEGKVYPVRAEFSPDDARIVVVYEAVDYLKKKPPPEYFALVWDVVTGKCLSEPLRHQDSIFSARFSPDGSRIVTASRDMSAQLWDGMTGKKAGDPMQHPNYVYHATFSPDGKRIYSGRGDYVAAWDAITGKGDESAGIHTGRVNDFQLAADRRHVVAGAGKIHTVNETGTAQIWDLLTQKPVGAAMHHIGGVTSAMLSPDGTRVVTTCPDDDAVRVWHVGSLLRLPMPVPEWVTRRCLAMAGRAFTEEFGLEMITEKERLETLREPVVGSDPWARLMRWAASPVTERSASPDSRLTLRQLAERERDTEMTDGIKSALRCDPTVPLAHVLLGEALLRDAAAGRKPPAPRQAAFLRAYGLKIIPDDAALWSRAAASLARQLDLEAALKAADKALSLDARNLSALRTRAAVLLKLKRDDEALAAHRALVAAPASEQGDFIPGIRLAHSLGNSAEAGALLDQGLRKLPDISAWARATIDVEKQKDHAVALMLVDKLLSLDARNLLLLRIRSHVLKEFYRDADAFAAYRAVLDAGGIEPQDFAMPAYLAGMVGNKTEADYFLAAGRARLPDSERLARMEGWTRISLGDGATAVAAFQRARPMTKDADDKPRPAPFGDMGIPAHQDASRDTDLLAGLAISYWLTNRQDQAVSTYHELILAQKEWAAPDKIAEARWLKAEAEPMEAVRAETIKRHPELLEKEKKK